jgi:hypothetical protein
MKKTILTSIFTSIFLAAATATAIANPNTTYAFGEEAPEYVKYYDINHDDTINVSDLVIGMQFLDEGVFSKIDTDNIYKLMFHEEINLDFMEFDIDYMETSPENINYLQTISAEYCCDAMFDGDCFRIRYLMDGKITEMRCSRAAEPTDFVMPICHDILNALCVSNGTEFAYKPSGFTFSTSNLKNYRTTAADLREKLYRAGEFHHFSLEGDEIHLFFKGDLSTTEITIPNSGDVSEEAFTFQNDGKEISVGLNSEGYPTYNIRSYNQFISSAYQLYDLDYLNFEEIDEIRELIASSGEYQKMTITHTENDQYTVKIFFGNDLSTTELKLTHFSDNIVETIGFYRYDGKCVQLGLDSDGRVGIGYIGNYITEIAE